MVVKVDHFDKRIGIAICAQNADFVLVHGALQFHNANIFTAHFLGESRRNL